MRDCAKGLTVTSSMNSSVEHPYLSVVVVARNDDYGGMFLDRMQAFINNLGELAGRHRLDMELIVVEWNPPEDQDRLRGVLSWPAFLNERTRFLTVSRQVHEQFSNADRIPVFEYIGKNAGIRRARGRFVLATNPDLLYSDELIGFFAAERLSEDSFYRVDRYDVQRVPADLSVDEQLRLCRRRWSQVHTLRRLITKKKVRRYLPWLLRESDRFFRDPQTRLRHNTARVHQRRHLHIRASGDFILMAKEAWHRLKGFPEFNTYSHIDSFMCAMAAASGLRQAILPFPFAIFHQEHGRSENDGRPLTDLQEFFRQCDRMLAEGHERNYNVESWGLQTCELLSQPITPVSVPS